MIGSEPSDLMMQQQFYGWEAGADVGSNNMGIAAMQTPEMTAAMMHQYYGAAAGGVMTTGAAPNASQGAPDSRKIFVGGLWDTTEDDLMQYFSVFGQVLEVN